jgi:hypothetical protein
MDIIARTETAGWQGVLLDRGHAGAQPSRARCVEGLGLDERRGPDGKPLPPPRLPFSRA